MANDNLRGIRVAILATDGFEESELLEPRKALDNAGATTMVVSPKDGNFKGWNMKDWGHQVPVDIPLKEAKADCWRLTLSKAEP
jgi:protease I